MSTAPRPSVTIVLLALVCAVWGSTWLVIKFGLRDLPPLTGAGMRFALAGATMFLVVRALGTREGGAPPPVWLAIAHGLGQFAANYGIVYYATTELPSGLVSVLWSVFPLLMGLAGHFVVKSERLRPAQWLGFLVGFFGIVLLFITDIRAISARAVIAGLILLLAPTSVVVATTLVKRHGAGMSSLRLNRDGMLVAAVALLVLGWTLERDQPLTLTPLAIGTIVYLAVPGTVFTFGVYMWLLRSIPAYRLSLTSYVTPVIAILLGAAWGGERIGSATAVGTLLVLSGIGLANLASPRPPRTPAAPSSTTARVR